MKNKAKKAVSKAMIAMNYKIAHVGVTGLVKGLKTDSKEVEGGRCVSVRRKEVKSAGLYGKDHE